jgi:ABC-2 type transport system ATP-binding protein
MAGIGAVLEGARNVYWRLTAWQNLLYFGRLKGQTRQLDKRAELLLKELDLWDRRDDEVRLFSRGMQQKVALASALMNNPSILLLDEPTLGLDVQAARTIKQMIKQLAVEEGKTIVLTTHQLEIAQEVCNQIAIISRGQLVANHPVKVLLRMFSQEYYEIRLRSSGFVRQAGSFGGLTVIQNDNELVLTGPMTPGQITTLLAQAQEKGLSLVSVNRTEPDLEDVFMTLVAEE